jgi:hypothetical protein
MDNSLCSTSMRVAILIMYGFDVIGQNISAIEKPTMLIDFMQICVVAVQYEIDGLLEVVLKAASEALTGCLSHEDEERVDSALSHFFGFGVFGWDSMLNDARYTPLMLKVLREHVHEINDEQVFRKLLDDNPLLVRGLFDAVVDDLPQKAKGEK